MRILESACVAPMVVAILMAGAVLVGCSQSEASAAATVYSGLDVYTDSLTGCQYVVRQGAYQNSPVAMYPRMRADGTQVCLQNDQAR